MTCISLRENKEIIQATPAMVSAPLTKKEDQEPKRKKKKHKKKLW
jgi:hypothetical protein